MKYHENLLPFHQRYVENNQFSCWKSQFFIYNRVR